jgi:hypothetical protein
MELLNTLETFTYMVIAAMLLLPVAHGAGYLLGKVKKNLLSPKIGKA